MRLRARNVGDVVKAAPGYEFLVEIDDRLYEDLKVTVDEKMRMVTVKVLGEKVYGG